MSVVLELTADDTAVCGEGVVSVCGRVSVSVCGCVSVSLCGCVSVSVFTDRLRTTWNPVTDC